MSRVGYLTLEHCEKIRLFCTEDVQGKSGFPVPLTLMLGVHHKQKPNVDDLISP